MKTLWSKIILEDTPFKAILALVKDSLIYLIGTIIIGFGNFFLIPLYTHYLTPTEFGVYALIDVTILVLVIVTQLGVGVSYLKWFADLGEAQRGAILGSALILTIPTALLCGGLFSLAVTSPLGERWLQTADRSFAWSLLPIVVLENLQGTLLTDVRARRRTAVFAIYAVIRQLTMLGASLWFITIQQQGVYGVLLGRLAGNSAGMLVLAFSCLGVTRLSFVRSISIGMMRYGLPLIWSGLVWIMMEASGRYFLSYYSTMEQAGLYSAASKIANIFQMLIIQPFSLSWGSIVFQLSKRPNASLLYSKIISVTLIVSSTVASIMTLFGSELFALFTAPVYFEGEQILLILLLVRVAQLMDYPLSAGGYLKSATWTMAAIWTIGLVLNVVAGILLVPEYGMFGAACAWLIGEVAITVLLAFAGKLYYPAIQYELVPCLVMLGFFASVWWLRKTVHEDLVLSIVVSFVLILIAVAAIRVSLFEKTELLGGTP